jgi:hypothetical protein
VQLLRHPGQGLGHEVAGVVSLDLLGVLGEVGLQCGEVGGPEVVAVALEVLGELEDAALGTEQHLLRDCRALHAPRGVAEVLAQQVGLGHERLAEHVTRREAVHGIGHGDQRERG